MAGHFYSALANGLKQNLKIISLSLTLSAYCLTNIQKKNIIFDNLQFYVQDMKQKFQCFEKIDLLNILIHVVSHFLFPQSFSWFSFFVLIKRLISSYINLACLPSPCLQLNTWQMFWFWFIFFLVSIIAECEEVDKRQEN